MIIPIDERWRIASDQRQWIIQEIRTRNGEIEWEPQLYFSSLPRAIKALGEMMVRLSDAQTVADALVDIDNVVTTLSRAIPTQFEVTLVVKEVCCEDR